MHRYICRVCKGVSDPGELIQGVCWDCREEIKEERSGEKRLARMEPRGEKRDEKAGQYIH